MIRRLGTIANRKKVAARIDFLFLGSRDGFRDCAIGGMNIDVTLWAKWHGCGAGRSELGCSAGWTLGWVYGAATWNDAAPQVDIWNSAMFEFARSACLPISRTSRRVRGFQRRLRRSPLLRDPARCLDPPIASDKHGFEVGVPFCVVFCLITSHDQKCC